jgi:uncharacterized protein (TIGR02246 family)
VGSYTNTKKKGEVRKIGDLSAEIASANKAFMEAFNRGDAAGVAALYTDEGRALPPNAETVVGRQAIQAMWQGAMDMGVKEAKLETVDLMPMGEKTACDIGKYTLKIQPKEGVTVTDTGKYVVIWKHDGESWKLDIDIWNTSLPPQ